MREQCAQCLGILDASKGFLLPIDLVRRVHRTDVYWCIEPDAHACSGVNPCW